MSADLTRFYIHYGKDSLPDGMGDSLEELAERMHLSLSYIKSEMSHNTGQVKEFTVYDGGENLRERKHIYRKKRNGKRVLHCSEEE